MGDLTSMEMAVLEKSLDGKSQTFKILHNQLGSLKLVDRHLTGVGF